MLILPTIHTIHTSKKDQVIQKSYTFLPPFVRHKIRFPFFTINQRRIWSHVLLRCNIFFSFLSIRKEKVEKASLSSYDLWFVQKTEREDCVLKQKEDKRHEQTTKKGCSEKGEHMKERQIESHLAWSFDFYEEEECKNQFLKPNTINFSPHL